MKTTKRLPVVVMPAASDDGHLGIGHLEDKPVPLIDPDTGVAREIAPQHLGLPIGTLMPAILPQVFSVDGITATCHMALGIVEYPVFILNVKTKELGARRS